MDRPGKRKRWKAALILGAVFAAALVFAYVFLYDGLGLVDRTISWRAELPEDMTLDDSLSGSFVTWENDCLYARISRERSPYIDVQEYIDHYFNRFLDSPDWQAANGARVLDRDDRGPKRHITIRLDDMPEGLEDTYTLVTLRTGTRYFIRALLKYDSRVQGSRAPAAVDRFLRTLRPAVSFKARRTVTEFEPVLPDGWSEETRAAYDKLLGADEPYFGAFSPELDKTEAKLDHSFALALAYFHLNGRVPLEEMEAWYEQGKLTELTMQCTSTNNLELYTSAAPVLDILRGRWDGTLETIAGDLRAFGHPVLFRLNNEMNSDWCSYSGVVNLCDPDLYAAAWRYIYDFFTDRGVDNLIWVWNPNDRSFPPANWNACLAYWPGNGYVHMLGVTGYNTGTYYARENGETWRDFDEIYESIDKGYGRYFGDFPWIITEFASSSVGGDKAGWIRDMFAGIGRYERIKAAVWFDYADYDGSGAVARPYWIAETEETLEAFREGIKDKSPRFFD